jgi:[protein-PII] uridylyltransferase
VIEIRAPDRAGLLHDVTTALFGQGLDVTTARVSTLGEDVVDAFYVRDRDQGGKVTDPDRLTGVEAAVLAALERERPEEP